MITGASFGTFAHTTQQDIIVKGEADDPFSRLHLIKHITDYYERPPLADYYWACPSCKIGHTQYALVGQSELRATPLPTGFFEDDSEDHDFDPRFHEPYMSNVLDAEGSPSTAYYCRECGREMGHGKAVQEHPIGESVDQEVMWSGTLEITDVTTFVAYRGQLLRGESIDLSLLCNGRVKGPVVVSDVEWQHGTTKDGTVLRLAFRTLHSLEGVESLSQRG